MKQIKKRLTHEIKVKMLAAEMQLNVTFSKMTAGTLEVITRDGLLER